MVVWYGMMWYPRDGILTPYDYVDVDVDVHSSGRKASATGWVKREDKYVSNGKGPIYYSMIVHPIFLPSSIIVIGLD